MIFALIPNEIAYILSIFAYSTLINILFMGFHFYLKKWIADGKDNPVLLAYSMTFLLLMIGRICFVIFDYILTDFDLALYNTYLVYWKISMAFVLLGYGIFLYIVTLSIFSKNKRIRITSILTYCIPIIIMMFMNTIELTHSVTAISFVSLIVVPLGYGYIASQSEGKMRKSALTIMIGLIFFVLSYALLAELMVQFLINTLDFSRYEIHFFSAIGKSISILIIINSYKSMLVD